MTYGWLIMLMLVAGCATKDKCVYLEFQKEGETVGSLEMVGPGTSWFAIQVGKFDAKGPGVYKSCPVGADPVWMRTPPPSPPAGTP